MPLKAITAVQWRGIDSIKLRMRSCGKFCHWFCGSYHNSLFECVLFPMRSLNSCHKCSIQFKSDDYDGQSKTWTLLKNSFTNFDKCLRSLSC